MTKRVLVTGASGLIGRMTLGPLAAQGFETVAFSRKGNVAGADLTINCDILDRGSRIAAIKAANASHMLHLAWYDGSNSRWNAPENQDWALATVELVRDFAAQGGKRAVCLGSCAEYDWSNEVLHEATRLKPNSPYGKAKVQVGTELLESAPGIGLSLAWARAFFCYGPGEPKGRLLGDLLLGLSKGELVPCTDGLQERDYLHSADYGRALVAILASDISGPVNVASGQSTMVRDMITKTADLMDARDLVQLGARGRPDNDPVRLVADITKLKSLGFRPEFDLASGLENCVSEFRK